jgi:hypothetical protein
MSVWIILAALNMLLFKIGIKNVQRCLDETKVSVASEKKRRPIALVRIHSL